jgi:hypothetical protein
VKIDKVFVEFGGDTSNDKECYGYSSTKRFESYFQDAEVIEFVSKEKFDKAVEALKKECWSGAYGVEGKSCNCEPCTTLKELGVES